MGKIVAKGDDWEIIEEAEAEEIQKAVNPYYPPDIHAAMKGARLEYYGKAGQKMIEAAAGKGEKIPISKKLGLFQKTSSYAAAQKAYKHGKMSGMTKPVFDTEGFLPPHPLAPKPTLPKVTFEQKSHLSPIVLGFELNDFKWGYAIPPSVSIEAGGAPLNHLVADVAEGALNQFKITYSPKILERMASRIYKALNSAGGGTTSKLDATPPKAKGRPRFSRLPFHHEVQTQKAKGILRLNGMLPSRWMGIELQGPTVLQVFPYYVTKSALTKFPLFARPCPMVPRHGFVESRVVKDAGELLDVWMETQHAERDPEMVVMPPLTGRYSAIVNNAGATWGRGNDGATDGTAGGSILIPTQQSAANWLEAHLDDLSLHAVGVKENAFLELVEHKGRTTVVQMRDGPEVEGGSPDWVPKDMTVQKVLDPEGLDLLQWEQLVKGNAHTSGTVVSMRGGNLSSHYAIHAIIHGIPVVTSRHVGFGSELTATGKGDVTPLGREDYRALAENVRKWLDRSLVPQTRKPSHKEDPFWTHWEAQNAAASTAVATVHAQARWGNDAHLMRLRAFSFAMLARLLPAALAGELRHGWSRGMGNELRKAKWRGFFTGRRQDATHNRQRIYNAVMTPEPGYLSALERFANDASHDFNELEWRGSYGGEKWGQVAEASVEYIKALRKFLKRPGKVSYKRMVAAANVLIHTAHNNGAALNKWVGSGALDLIANAPQMGFANIVAAKIVLGDEVELYTERKDAV